MPILDHFIVPSRACDAAAKFLADVLGVRFGDADTKLCTSGCQSFDKLKLARRRDFGQREISVRRPVTRGDLLIAGMENLATSNGLLPTNPDSQW